MKFLNFFKKETSTSVSFEEFMLKDNRTKRTFNPVSNEQMIKKHSAMFPENLVKNKTILDLGACLGATGHWCLSLGASSYLGVETQEKYVDDGNALLKKYYKNKGKIIHSNIEDFLAKNTESFDIVCLLGVMYVFVDYYSLLKSVTSITKQSLIIEGIYPDLKFFDIDFCGVEFSGKQLINLATKNASLIGRGSRISPEGLSFILKDFGFDIKEQVYPKRIKGSYDIYNQSFFKRKSTLRYMVLFSRSQKETFRSLSNDLSFRQSGSHVYW